MRIGELSERVGVAPPTIRYYEQVGLLPDPARNANGYREYDDTAVERLQFIRAAQTMGFTLGEIKEIVACWERGDPICEPVVALIERRLADLSAQIQSLQRARSNLRTLLRAARTGPSLPAGVCHVIERGAPRRHVAITQIRRT